MKSSFYASNQPDRHHQRKALMRLALWGGLMAYMTYHLLHGNRGLLALWKIRRIVQEEREVLTKLEDETETLARQIRLCAHKVWISTCWMSAQGRSLIWRSPMKLSLKQLMCFDLRRLWLRKLLRDEWGPYKVLWSNEVLFQSSLC